MWLVVHLREDRQKLNFLKIIRSYLSELLLTPKRGSRNKPKHILEYKIPYIQLKGDFGVFGEQLFVRE